MQIYGIFVKTIKNALKAKLWKFKRGWNTMILRKADPTTTFWAVVIGTSASDFICIVMMRVNATQWFSEFWVKLMDDHLSTNPKIFAINKQTDHHRKINIILKTQTQSGHRIRKTKPFIELQQHIIMLYREKGSVGIKSKHVPLELLLQANPHKVVV